MNGVKKLLAFNHWLIEKNVMGGARSSDGGGERRVQVFGGET
jgi:hypothetical protein